MPLYDSALNSIDKLVEEALACKQQNEHLKERIDDTKQLLAVVQVEDIHDCRHTIKMLKELYRVGPK